MEASIILLPSTIKQYSYKDMWKTLVRATVRSLRRQGHSYGQIKALTSLERSTIQGIVKAPFLV